MGRDQPCEHESPYCVCIGFTVKQSKPVKGKVVATLHYDCIFCGPSIEQKEIMAVLDDGVLVKKELNEPYFGTMHYSQVANRLPIKRKGK